MLCRLLAASAGHFWKTLYFENIANANFDYLNHLKNLVPLFMTEPYNHYDSSINHK